MSTTFVAENEDAEKLLKYLVSYRNSVAGTQKVDEDKTILEDNVSMGVISENVEITPTVKTQKK